MKTTYTIIIDESQRDLLAKALDAYPQNRDECEIIADMFAAIPQNLASDVIFDFTA